MSNVVGPVSRERQAGTMRARFRRDRIVACAVLIAFGLVFPASTARSEDRLRALQTAAVEQGRSDAFHWGTRPDRLSNWTSHSNRLIPVYSFGWTLEEVAGARSVYRSEDAVRRIYGRIPEETVNSSAEYFDQTDVHRLQARAAEAGKRLIVLIVFDGMDWQTTRAAAIARSNQAGYASGRGNGLHFQDYRGATTDFGFMVTSPHNDGTSVDVNAQTVANPGGKTAGGYSAARGGATPWSVPPNGEYLIGKNRDCPHAVTDSASSATSMTAGIKTYNDSINVDAQGAQAQTIAHQLQKIGYAIGVVSSVPISHATPAAAYAHNVHRDDYQDLTRDLLGRRSVSHPEHPSPGVDVLLGAGWGVEKAEDSNQGTNFEAGNRFIAPSDLAAIDAATGGPYRVVHRTAGMKGREVLDQAARAAIDRRQRLFGLFGHKETGHLHPRTADGNHNPTAGVAIKAGKLTPVAAESYSEADIAENPTLADMTRTALDVLASRSDSFWLLIEAGDVDWANHSNNIDSSIGAVMSGDDAFHAVTEWVETRGAWEQTAVIVTADHGHYLVLDHPEALLDPTTRPAAP